MGIIDDIKSKIALVDYVSPYAPDLKRTGVGKWKCKCPIHVEDTPSFYIDEAKQKWHCFGACATGGDVIDFAMKKHGWSQAQAIDELAKEAGIERTHGTPVYEHLYAALNAAVEFYRDDIKLLGNPALDHLKRRGLTDAIEPFKLGFSTGIEKRMLEAGYSRETLKDAGIIGEQGDMVKGRLVIPLFDERGRVVGFSGRALVDGVKPKFINSHKTAVFDRGAILYGFAQGKHAISSSDSAVIVEGYMDVMKAHIAGFKNVVAQMGTGLNEKQAALLSGRRIIIALDGDKAGYDAALGVIEQAGKVSKRLFVLTLPEGKDPDDLIDSGEWDTDKAVPVLDFMIDIELNKAQPKAYVERKAVADRLMAHVDTADTAEAMYAAQKIALAVGLPDTSLMNIQTPTVTYAPIKTNAVNGNLEALCALGYLLHWSYVNREFRRIDIELPSPSDFLVHGTLFSTVCAAIQQYDMEPIDYVCKYFPESQMPDVSQDVIVSGFFQLRIRAIREADTDDKSALMIQKAKILAYTHP